MTPRSLADLHFSISAPFRYEHPRREKLAGFAAYLLVLAFVVLFAWLIAGGLLYGILGTVGLEEPARMSGFLVLAVPAVAMFAWLGLREYRNCLGASLVVTDSEIQAGYGRKVRSYSIDDIRDVHLLPRRGKLCVAIVLSSGKRILLPPEVADYDALRDALDGALLPKLAGHFREELRAGNVIGVKESPAAAIARMIAGIVSMLGTPLMLAYGWRSAMNWWKFSRDQFARGLRGREGGFFVAENGLVADQKKPSDAVPWNEIHVAKSDHRGMILRSDAGATFAVSNLAANYLSFSRWVDATFVSEPA